MNLTLSEIQEITFGAARVEAKEDGVHFYRFTKEQELLYKERRDNFYKKTFSTSGIQLRFRTDSQTLLLKVEVSVSSTRKYFAFDVFVDGEKLDSLNNFSDAELPVRCPKSDFPLGEHSKEFQLGAGEKEVCVVFPWSVVAVVKELALDDNSFIIPNKRSKKMLCFGDSITHGYDALYPSNKYISKLAKMLDAEEFNKAIGGEIYFPALAATKEDFEPDYVVVSYGCNDWNRCAREEFTENCKEFLTNIHKNYSASKVIVIAPIWCKKSLETRVFGSFEDVAPIIREQAAPFDNMSVINGCEFVPQDEAYFTDGVHPNNAGFELYFENLAKAVSKL